GDADTVISPERVDFATTWLKENAQVELHVYQGLPHSISPEEVRDIARFMQKHIL
ncbi:phospholipase, partial [Streptococcus danieliae]|nr:phospholipase [Streptococcus danieliae]